MATAIVVEVGQVWVKWNNPGLTFTVRELQGSSNPAMVFGDLLHRYGNVPPNASECGYDVNTLLNDFNLQPAA